MSITSRSSFFFKLIYSLPMNAPSRESHGKVVSVLIDVSVVPQNKGYKTIQESIVGGKIT